MICECGQPATVKIGRGGAEICCVRCAALDGHGRLEAELIRNLIDGPHMPQHLIELTGSDKALVFRTLKNLIKRGRVRKVLSDEYHSVKCVREWVGRGFSVQDTKVPEVSIYMLTNPMRQES